MDTTQPSTEESKIEPVTVETVEDVIGKKALDKKAGANGSLVEGQIDYKAKIYLFLEMEKLKLINQAVAAGLSEQDVNQAFSEENLIDFSLEHLKVIIKDMKKSNEAKLAESAAKAINGEAAA